MAATRAKPKYIVIEYEPQNGHDNLAAATEEARRAHEADRTRGYAVVEIVSTVSSEHKTIVTRLR